MNQMNKEIGGYFELDTYSLPMLHGEGIKLNCGRNALAYLIEANNIKELWMPYFMCDSVINVCDKYKIKLNRYHINNNFFPIISKAKKDDWIYITNYYGQLDEEISELANKYTNIIVDNAHSYFSKPLKNINTLYTCRKFFGVSDGAILYTNQKLNRFLNTDLSFERIKFVLGRYEKNASEFFELSSYNNEIFDKEDIKFMSKLTENMLHAIDYAKIKNTRTNNYKYLHSNFSDLNNLELKNIEGAYMYPLMINNAQKIKKELIKNRIYIPTLWPNILNELDDIYLEYKFAKNILPLPCDQRYNLEDMDRMIKIIKEKI